MIRHEIERHLVQPQEMEIVLYLDPMLYWFNGHFAVQPLLPGVAQLDWVMHYATTLLAPGWRVLSHLICPVLWWMTAAMPPRNSNWIIWLANSLA